MKTIEIERTNVEEWKVSEWDNQCGCVCVYTPGSQGLPKRIGRERSIPDHWPDEVKRAARTEILTHRPLAENQVLDASGTIFELRWCDGRRECRAVPGGMWGPWHYAGAEKALAWFRANCPIDRFVTDDGKLLTFRMRDDGRAQAVRHNGSIQWETNCDNYGGDTESLIALYRFRDHERGKWTFEMRDDGVLVSGPGHEKERGRANIFPVFPVTAGEERWSSHGEMLPTYIRRKAEAMWRERQRPGKVTHEARVSKMNWHADNQPVRGWCGNLVGFANGPNPYVELICDDGTEVRVTGVAADIPPVRGRVRVTIEPLESEGV